MLKEAVDLIDFASAIRERYAAESDDTEFCNALQGKINALKDAVGRRDEEKRKTDEAVCLLFRANGLMASLVDEHGFTDTKKEVDARTTRAERLLGFAALEPAAV